MTPETPVTTPMPPPGWYPSPDGQYAHRWWDGAAWTDVVAPVSAPAGAVGPTTGSAEQWLLPTGRSWVAILAGYLGLFALVILPAPLALISGIAALAHLRKHPDLGGRGRAWFAVVTGGLGTTFLTVAVVLS